SLSATSMTWNSDANRLAHVVAAFAKYEPVSTCVAVGGDGCDANCEIDPGWLCPVAGRDCVAESCGDGIVAGAEECESNVTFPSNACDSDRSINSEYSCQRDEGGRELNCLTVREACDNDGNLEFGEYCDDGDNDTGDGCSPFCEYEPRCRPAAGGATTACTSVCGDGFLLASEIAGNPNACDDGNTTNGDGCSDKCVVEPGWQCSASGVAATVIDVPVVFRDVIAIARGSGTRHP